VIPVSVSTIVIVIMYILVPTPESFEVIIYYAIIRWLSQNSQSNVTVQINYNNNNVTICQIVLFVDA
jgi:hypothetical protein